MGKKHKKSPPEKFSEGELRRFELTTEEGDALAKLDRVIRRKKLSRNDLGTILLCLRVRPEIDWEAFGISLHSTPERLSKNRQ